VPAPVNYYGHGYIFAVAQGKPGGGGFFPTTDWYTWAGTSLPGDSGSGVMVGQLAAGDLTHGLGSTSSRCRSATARAWRRSQDPRQRLLPGERRRLAGAEHQRGDRPRWPVGSAARHHAARKKRPPLGVAASRIAG
jgi:hypothetical protein